MALVDTEEKLKEVMAAAGYKKVKFHSPMYRFGKDGVRIVCHARGSLYTVEVFVRSERGGYAVVYQSSRLDDTDISFLTLYQGKEVDPNRLATPEKPFAFNENEFNIESGNSYGPIVTWTQIIKSVRVIKITSFGKDRKLDECKIVTPGTEAWFMLACTSFIGATFSILYNKEGWLPVGRDTGRVTQDMKPKASLNLAAMNDRDREIIEKAVELYVANLQDQSDQWRLQENT